MGPAGDISLGIGAIGSTSGSAYGLFDAAGRINFGLGSKLNVEIEGSTSAVFNGGSSLTYHSTLFGHFWHPTATGAWGVFAGADWVEASAFTSIGVEFKHFLAQASWGAFAAYTNAESTGLGSFGAVANYYFNPNHRVGFAVAALTDFNAAYWVVQADAEHRFNRFALWGAASYTGFSGGSGGLWTALIGGRLFFDPPGTTLQQHERLVPWNFRQVVLD
jgi:hypothetical protein